MDTPPQMVTHLQVPTDTHPHNKEYLMVIQDRVVTQDLLMDTQVHQMDTMVLLMDMLAIMADIRGFLMDMSMDMMRETPMVLTVAKGLPLTEIILVTMGRASLSIMDKETAGMVRPRMDHPQVVHPDHNRVSFTTTSQHLGKAKWLDKILEVGALPGGELQEIPWTCQIVNIEALPLNCIRNLDINQDTNLPTRMCRGRATEPSPTLLIDVIHAEFGPLLVIAMLYLYITRHYVNWLTFIC